MSGYKDREVWVNGKRYFIQDFGDNAGCFIFVIVIAAIFWIGTQIYLGFNMPTEEDFNSKTYKAEAMNVASKYILMKDTAIWKKTGFIAYNSENDRAEKTFKISTHNKYSDADEAVKYLGNGCYQVYTGTLVELIANSPDGRYHNTIKRIPKECIITIKSSPRRNWYATINLGWKIQDEKIVSFIEIDELVKIVDKWVAPKPLTPKW